MFVQLGWEHEPSASRDVASLLIQWKRLELQRSEGEAGPRQIVRGVSMLGQFLADRV